MVANIERAKGWRRALGVAALVLGLAVLAGLVLVAARGLS